jgi:hypothetical protein
MDTIKIKTCKKCNFTGDTKFFINKRMFCKKCSIKDIKLYTLKLKKDPVAYKARIVKNRKYYQNLTKEQKKDFAIRNKENTLLRLSKLSKLSENQDSDNKDLDNNVSERTPIIVKNKKFIDLEKLKIKQENQRRWSRNYYRNMSPEDKKALNLKRKLKREEVKLNKLNKLKNKL